jgi:hypothetical protein
MGGVTVCCRVTSYLNFRHPLSFGTCVTYPVFIVSGLLHHHCSSSFVLGSVNLDRILTLFGFRRDPI